MIFVTVGTNPTMHFDRLLKPMDRLAAELEEPVIMQTGCSRFVPQNAEYFDFTTSRHIDELYRAARIVVSHAAAGSVITALQHGKSIIVAPRRHHRNEHIDDHQMELAKALDTENRAVIVYEPALLSLRQAIQKANERIQEGSGPEPLMRALRTQLDAWQNGAPTIIHSAARKL